MTDVSGTLPNFAKDELPDRMSMEDVEANRYTEAALERHKREGLDLAVKARWCALGATGIMLPFLNPDWSVLYYECLLLMSALVGHLQRRVGRVGRSGAELLLLFVDLSLLTFALLVPNPFGNEDYPTALIHQYDTFQYFYIILAAGTLSYSWRTILAIGNWAGALWLLGSVGVWYFGTTYPELTAVVVEVFGEGEEIARLLDPNSMHWDMRIQQVVVFLIISGVLAVTVRRFNRLLLGNAALERERENLSRYFSPNVVERLSQNDDPLKEIRTHNVAVLFVDIVGFTTYAADRHPEEVIKTLRSFHGRMETEVFRHNGTLDKYLGDGLMATFGTPVASERDASNALACVKSMIQVTEQLNAERRTAGEPEIKASFGLHYGPVVLGDIGANRLEFAVIGNTVNVASRLEALTRSLDTQVVASEDLHNQVRKEVGEEDPVLAGLQAKAPQDVRGLDRPVPVWSLN